MLQDLDKSSFPSFVVYRLLKLLGFRLDQCDWNRLAVDTAFAFFSFTCAPAALLVYWCAQVFSWKLYVGRLKFFCANHGFWTSSFQPIDSSPTHTRKSVMQICSSLKLRLSHTWLKLLRPGGYDVLLKRLFCYHVYHVSIFTLLGREIRSQTTSIVFLLHHYLLQFSFAIDLSPSSLSTCAVYVFHTTDGV